MRAVEGWERNALPVRNAMHGAWGVLRINMSPRKCFVLSFGVPPAPPPSCLNTGFRNFGPFFWIYRFLRFQSKRECGMWLCAGCSRGPCGSQSVGAAVILCALVLCCVVLCCVMLCCVVLCCVVLCCVVLCCVVLCCVVLCCVMLCCVMLCCVVLCCVVLCCVVLCCVVLCCVLWCCVCRRVGHPFVVMNRRWPMPAKCVPWYAPCGNTGLSKHADRVFPHFCPLNQNLARVGTRGKEYPPPLV